MPIIYNNTLFTSHIGMFLGLGGFLLKIPVISFQRKNPVIEMLKTSTVFKIRRFCVADQIIVTVLVFIGFYPDNL